MDTQAIRDRSEASNGTTCTPADIVVLTAGGPFPEVVANAIAAQFRSVAIVQETPESKGEIFRRWVKLRGWKTALGQLAFGPAQKIAALRARARRNEILSSADAKLGWPSHVPIHRVDTVNADACRDVLHNLAPKVVVVVGTRMIRRKTLQSVRAPIINYHAGLNPAYRGQYGGYWAFATGDDAHAGVTVHLVDEGVDTGAALYSATIERTPRDTVATFHYLQVVTAVPLILRAIEDALSNRLSPQTAEGPSKQWFHPTVWQYLGNGLRRGLW